MKKLSIILAVALLLVLAGALPVAAEGPTMVVLGGDIAAAVGAQGSPEVGPLGLSSWAAVQTSKMELYIDPTVPPFNSLGTFTIDDIQSISYQTKKPGAQGDPDFYLVIYTVPDSADDSGTWYGYRLNAEPYFSQDLNAPANQWNTWTTDDTTNQLTFFDSAKTGGGYGFYGQPTLQDLQAGEINWHSYDTSYTDQAIDYGAETVKYISFQTGSGWHSTFFGNIDAITINLTGGRSLTLDLEKFYPEVWVDDNADTSSYALPGHYQTIVGGLANVADGGTVHVAAGTYEESPTVNERVTLQGPLSGEPAVIEGTLTLNDGADGTIINRISFLAVGSHDSLVLNRVDSVEIANCAFDGAGGFMTGGRAVQIYSPSSNMTIESCTFTNGYYVTIQGSVNDLTVRNSSIEDVKSGINLQGGSNLVVENTDISVIAKGVTNDTYCVRFASSTTTSSGDGMRLAGGTYAVDKAGLTAATGTYHSAIIVRSGATGTLQANWLSIDGEVVNLSTTELDAKYNYWGQPTGPAQGQIRSEVVTSPWLTKAPQTREFPDGPALVVNAIPESVVGGQEFVASVYVVPGSYEVFGFEFALDVPDGLTLTTVEPGAFLAGLEQFDETDGSGSYTWLVPDTLTDTLHVHVSLLDNETDSMRGILGGPAEVVTLTFAAGSVTTCSAEASLNPTEVILTQKQDGAQILSATTEGDSIMVYKPVTAEGVVSLQGRDVHSGAGVTLTGAAGQPFSYATSTGDTGAWSVRNVACGTYNVYVDMMAYLDAKRDGAPVQADYNAGSVKLLGGNADETPTASENRIFLEDVVAIADVIGLPAPTPSDYKYPDINADGTINILDLVLAGINYTEEGPKTF